MEKKLKQHIKNIAKNFMQGETRHKVSMETKLVTSICLCLLPQNSKVSYNKQYI